MPLKSCWTTESERTFQKWWTSAPEAIGLSADLFARDASPQDRLIEVARTVQREFKSTGFRLFRNGGVPLLERRRGTWIEEIVFRMPPSVDKGEWMPFAIDIHVSCQEIADVRSRYWRVASRPDVAVAGGNIGLLGESGAWLMWNLAADGPGSPLSEPIMEKLREDVLPWLRLFQSPRMLRQRLFDVGIPRVDSLVAMEWCLLEYGPEEAGRYLEEVVCKRPGHRDRLRRLLDHCDSIVLEGGPEHSLEHNLAAMAVAYRISA